MTLGKSLLVTACISGLVVASAAGQVGNGVSVVAGSGGGFVDQLVQVSAQSTPAGVRGHFSLSGEFFHDMEARCIRTVGDRTIVGGVIVDSWNPVVIGRTSAVVVIDGGPGANDQMNLAFSISGLDACPSDVSTITLNPVTHGNYVVR